MKNQRRLNAGHKYILNKDWYRHLTPKEFHRHHKTFDYLFREYLGRYGEIALRWDAAGMSGVSVPVRVGDPLPRVHLLSFLKSDGWGYMYIPPQHNLKVKDNYRMVTNGRSFEIGEYGELFAHPEIYIEVITDPLFVNRILSSQQGAVAPGDISSTPFDPKEITQPSIIFSCPIGALVTNKRVHGNNPIPPRYVLYQHTFGNNKEYPYDGPFYIGITQRDWKRRWAEHKAAIARGSPLKFHKAFRERMKTGGITFIHHKIMDAVGDLALLYKMEELMVDGHWEDTRLLNMIPGGEKGLKYLHEHGILDRRTHFMPDHREYILEKWMRDHHRKGLPAPWVAEYWKDPQYARRIICGPDGRLSVEQVLTIRRMHEAGVPAENILATVKARSLEQVQRLIKGKTYSRI